MIVDAVGATETDLNEDQPLERRITVSLDKLLMRIATGAYDDDDVSSIASRLARLNTQLTPSERERIDEIAGTPMIDVIHGLVAALIPTFALRPPRLQRARRTRPEAVAQAAKQLLAAAVKPIADNPESERGTGIDPPGP